MSSIDVRAIDVKKLRKTPAPAAKQEFRVFLSEEAFDRAVERGDGDVTREVGGVLVGEVLLDDAGPYLRVDSTIDALHAKEKGEELTITHATWDHIHKEMDGKHKDKKVVGWYHTHPGFGIFLSDRDQFIHKNFFSEPFQVALVYDPKSREHGVFIWHDNELWRARRYWIGAREQIWDGQRGLPAAERDKADKAKAEKAKAGRAADSDESGGSADDAKIAVRDDGMPGSLASLIVVGLIMLIIGGFAGHWFGAAQVAQVQNQAQSELAVAKAEGAQAIATTMQTQLVDILYSTLSDEAVQKPVAMAVVALDQALEKLPQPPPPPPAPVAPAAGSGSAAGSAAPAAGSAAPAVSAAPAPAPAKPLSPTDAMLQDLAVQLRAVRDQLVAANRRRAEAEFILANISRAARTVDTLRTNVAHDVQDLARDVAGHRSGLGQLYAEMAGDAIKQGDKDKARRLLSAAAHLDPGNRTRYEKQLQSFDQTASLPRESEASDATGSAGSQQGSQR